MLAEYDKAAIAARFSRCAERYQQYANLQQASAQILRDVLYAEMLERSECQQELSEINVKPAPMAGSILDLGCGPGTQTTQLQRLGKRYVGVDIAHGMLSKAAQMNSDEACYIQADMENLPFAQAHFDLVYSNLAVQWSNNPLQLLLELKRITKPGGIIALATVLDNSLQPLAKLRNEFLRQAGVNQQSTLSDWLSWIAQADLECTFREEREVSVYFPDVRSLLRSISAIGADHQGSSSTPKLGLAEYTAIVAGYEQYRTLNGLPLSYRLGFILLKV
ncbi:hypothetical protein CWE13_01670 [Aliidiomarina shirensis]|uniref:Methyltransferase type 11 domain-containing protein n=1 Tax=Aliidiomarina shirensis TaxID=1048642 RepID=A0A432WX97_9GAMM|nr:methyltransferase domain-containing protein [Aliidiomarina shirensis]RUO38376.1 hypothetical protein CWE13_01670 [Aliidiomarina shirensis]